MTALIIEEKSREMILFGYQALKQFHRKFGEGEINLVEIKQTIQSWLGHASHANTYNLKKALLSKPFRRNSNE